MIDSWPEAGAVVGAVAIIAGAVIKVFASKEKKEDENMQVLLRNLADTTRILDRLAILMEHRETRTEELHKDTHKKIEESNAMHARKLDEITTNQREIISTIDRGLDRMRLA